MRVWLFWIGARLGMAVAGKKSGSKLLHSKRSFLQSQLYPGDKESQGKLWGKSLGEFSCVLRHVWALSSGGLGILRARPFGWLRVWIRWRRRGHRRSRGVR